MAVICNTCGLPEDLCACGELAKDSTKIIIRLETRRFKKKGTMIEGLDPKLNNLETVAKDLKNKYACGGTAKEVDGAEVEHERDFSAAQILLFEPCYFYVLRRRILPWPNPGVIITMELEEAQMRAVGKLKPERKTGAYGRQRKHHQTKIEGVGACHQFCDA